MSACAICGAEACDLHHLSGTDAEDRYLDPEFVVPLCHDDHEQIHDDWHTLGLHRAPERLSRPERIEIALRRLAVATGRFAEAHPEWTWAAEWANTFTRWADELAADLRARDSRDPGWREDVSFYPEGNS